MRSTGQSHNKNIYRPIVLAIEKDDGDTHCSSCREQYFLYLENVSYKLTDLSRRFRSLTASNYYCYYY